MSIKKYRQREISRLARFRKIPVIIEATQFLKFGDHPAVVVDARSPTGYAMYTPENTEIKHEVTLGDWIITGIAGEQYPCKPDIFARTYELVNE